ncbi:hypothetical protein, partial [Rhizobium oryzihabitans]|uniref:hypothetical protein n=1 Tax=Rhizobium oryzihabitans TaxID=2267833 RepID=UPI0040365DC4
MGERHDLADQLLALVVGGVRLAGEDELDATVVVREQRTQPVGLAEQQCGALVGGHAAREADGERVRVERVVDPGELRRGPPLGQAVVTQPVAHVVDHADLGGQVRLPQLVGLDPGHGLPG